jgi:hypothetical protein
MSNPLYNEISRLRSLASDLERRIVSERGIPVVEGTTWYADRNAYGTSYMCVVCGHWEFWEDSVPGPCPHQPEEWEEVLHKRRLRDNDRHK